MNITKGDVQELRRRLKKTECTFGRLCGCYVNSGKQIVTKFTEQFSELEEDEYYKYLEIAKKTFSGTLGANLLELEFDRSDSGIEHQKYLLTLKDSKLANEELLDRLYEQVIEEYSYPGNYLIVVYHDVYDVPSKATSGEDQDESTELYAYCVCAVCPVELAKPALGYREDENRIGARERDWVVGLPDLGFVYPAFANRGSDVNAVMYYVKTGRPSHPEFIENVLGCVAQRTAAEDKLAFKNVVHDAFGEDEEQADAAFFQMQKTISAMVAEREEDESLPPVELTAEAVSGLATEAEVPDSVRAQIEKSYEQVFGDQRRRRITCWTAVWSRRARSRRIPPPWSRRWQCCSRSWRIRRQTPPTRTRTTFRGRPARSSTFACRRREPQTSIPRLWKGRSALSFRSPGMNPRVSTAWKWNNGELKMDNGE